MTLLRILTPERLSEAACLLEKCGWDGMAIAGGTAVCLMMNQGLIQPTTLVSLDRIRDKPFREVVVDSPAVIRIGGGTSLATLSRHPIVMAQLPSFAYACSTVGNVRIRNRATIGGNLAGADYASDPPSVLVSLGASVQTVRAKAPGRTIPVRQLITGFYETALEPDELIQALIVPIVSAQYATYTKYRSRSSEDRPCVGVSVAGTAERGVISSLEVVVGAVADRPQRLPDVLVRAVGSPLDSTLVDDIASAYAKEIKPMDDARGSSWYRRRLIEVLVRRSLTDLNSALESL